MNQDVSPTSCTRNQHDDNDNITPELFPLKRQRTRKSLIDYSSGKISKKLKTQSGKAAVDADVLEEDSREQVDDDDGERSASVIRSVGSHSDVIPRRAPKNGESSTYQGRRSFAKKHATCGVNVDSSDKNDSRGLEEIGSHDADDKVSISSDASAETMTGSSTSRGRPRKRGKSKTGSA